METRFQPLLTERTCGEEVTSTMHSLEDFNPPLSVITSLKVSISPGESTGGAVNDGSTAVGSSSVTAFPPVWVQMYDTILPSESNESEPSSTTDSPTLTIWSKPASATGGLFTHTTFIMHESELFKPWSSVTVNSKVNVTPSGLTSGEIKDGCIVAALLRVTLVPPVWTQ